jgi:hypothetical protein
MVRRSSLSDSAHGPLLFVLGGTLDEQLLGDEFGSFHRTNRDNAGSRVHVRRKLADVPDGYHSAIGIAQLKKQVFALAVDPHGALDDVSDQMQAISLRRFGLGDGDERARPRQKRVADPNQREEGYDRRNDWTFRHKLCTEDTGRCGSYAGITQGNALARRTVDLDRIDS